ncbi:UNVERIFIED_ORG: hypothetical protein E4P37_06130 [Bacillus sp. AZ43]
MLALTASLLIVPRTFGLLRRTVSVLLESTPPGLDLEAVRAHLEELPGVIAVRGLHASQISDDLPVLTAHVVVEDACFVDARAPQLFDKMQDCLAELFPISVAHSTFQLEARTHADHELAAHR